MGWKKITASKVTIRQRLVRYKTVTQQAFRSNKSNFWLIFFSSDAGIVLYLPKFVKRY